MGGGRARSECERGREQASERVEVEAQAEVEEQVEDQDLDRGRAQGSQQEARLLFFALSLLALCLTAFNLYLFRWLWWSVGGERLGLGARLASRRPLEAEALLAGAGLRISSAHSVLVARGGRPLLELEAGPRRLLFAAGLRLKSAAGGQEALVCSPSMECSVRASCVRLAGGRPLDWGRKSAQAAKVSTRRLHSATGSLELLSVAAGSLEPGGPLSLLALAGLTLLSRNSPVSSKLAPLLPLLSGPNLTSPNQPTPTQTQTPTETKRNETKRNKTNQNKTKTDQQCR